MYRIITTIFCVIYNCVSSSQSLLDVIVTHNYEVSCY